MCQIEINRSQQMSINIKSMKNKMCYPVDAKYKRISHTLQAKLIPKVLERERERQREREREKTLQSSITESEF